MQNKFVSVCKHYLVNEVDYAFIRLTYVIIYLSGVTCLVKKNYHFTKIHALVNVIRRTFFCYFDFSV